MSKKEATLKGVLRGNLSYLVLRALREKQPLHGYAIIKGIERITGEMWKPTTGSVYPCLARMERQGLISVKREEGKGRKRKFYSVTKKGLAALEGRKNRIKGMVGSATEVYQHLFPKEIQDTRALFELLDQAKFFHREIIEVRLNMLKLMHLSRDGKLSASEKKAVKRKLQETSRLIQGIIEEKGK